MLFKIGMAILISLIAALISVIAGLTSDIRTGTVMLRAVFIFAVLGFGLTFIMFWIEKYGIPLYVSGHENEESEWLRLYNMLRDMEQQNGQEEAAEELAEEAAEEEPALVDVSVSDEIPAVPLTEDELRSLNGEPGEYMPAGQAPEAAAEEPEAGEPPAEEAQELPEETAEAEKAPEEKPPEFAPLAVENMTRMKLPAEETGA